MTRTPMKLTTFMTLAVTLALVSANREKIVTAETAEILLKNPQAKQGKNACDPGDENMRNFLQEIAEIGNASMPKFTRITECFRSQVESEDKVFFYNVVLEYRDNSCYLTFNTQVTSNNDEQLITLGEELEQDSWRNYFKRERDDESDADQPLLSQLKNCGMKEWNLDINEDITKPKVADFLKNFKGDSNFSFAFTEPDNRPIRVEDMHRNFVFVNPEDENELEEEDEHMDLEVQEEISKMTGDLDHSSQRTPLSDRKNETSAQRMKETVAHPVDQPNKISKIKLPEDNTPTASLRIKQPSDTNYTNPLLKSSHNRPNKRTKDNGEAQIQENTSKMTDKQGASLEVISTDAKFNNSATPTVGRNRNGKDIVDSSPIVANLRKLDLNQDQRTSIIDAIRTLTSNNQLKGIFKNSSAMDFQMYTHPGSGVYVIDIIDGGRKYRVEAKRNENNRYDIPLSPDNINSLQRQFNQYESKNRNTNRIGMRKDPELGPRESRITT